MRVLSVLLSITVVVVAIVALAILSSSSSPQSQTAVHHTPQHFPSSLSAMSKVAVIGSTGSVGRATVHSLSSHPSIASITAITRRPYFTSTTPTLHEHVVPDLFQLAPSDFEGADTVFCCLGTTRADAGGAEQFKRQDHDLIVLVAQKAKEAGVTHFHLVSSYGANINSSFLYTQSKGQTEADVTAVGFHQLGIWRPAVLDTSSYPREKARLGEKMVLPLFKLLRPLIERSAWRHIAVESVADAMVKDWASGREGVKLYDGSTVILDFVGEDKKVKGATAA